MKSYTFHVSIPGTGRVWRKIELRGDQTLHVLHMAIQDAYEFDADHLYSFFMSNRFWDSSTEYSIPSSSYDFLPEDEDEEEIDVLEDEFDFLEEITAESVQKVLDVVHSLDDEQRAEMVRGMVQGFGVLEPLAAQLLDAFAAFNDGEEFLETMSALEEIVEGDEVGDAITTTLDSLNLRKGKTFAYLFDYGDEWRFRIKVHAINENAPADVDYPILVESVGEAPPQYSDWDEDWDEDEWDDEDWDEGEEEKA